MSSERGLVFLFVLGACCGESKEGKYEEEAVENVIQAV